MGRNPAADLVVQLLPDGGTPDQTVTVIGDQVVTATPGDVGKVVTVDGDGNLVLAAGGGGGGAVDSVNGDTGVVVLDADDIDPTATRKYATAAQLAKVDHLTVTQGVDLDAIEAKVASLDAAVVLRGSWDASAGTFPGGGTAQAGDSYIVSVAGTVGGVAFAVGDRAIAITDNASTTVFAANWFKADYTDQVLSVNGRTGAVTGLAEDADVVHDTGDETIAGIKSFSSPPVVPADAYDSGWNGLQEPATKDGVWDALGAISAFGKSLAAAADAAAARATLRVYPAPIMVAKTDGNYTTSATGAGVYNDLDTTGSASARTYDLVFPNAQVGDWVEVEGAFRVSDTGAFAMLFDLYTIVAGARVNRFGTAGAGWPTWVVASGVARDIASAAWLQLQAGDIENGSARVRLVHLVQGARTIQANAVTPFRLVGKGPLV